MELKTNPQRPNFEEKIKITHATLKTAALDLLSKWPEIIKILMVVIVMMLFI